MDNKEIEVIPYLGFQGNCEEALEVYRRAFGGEILYMSRWSAENTKASSQMGKVMHTEFTLGRTRMSAGDFAGETSGNTDVKLMVHMDAQPEAESAVSLLAEGGAVLSPLKPHPKPDDGGCGALVRDRFGYTWIITCPNPAKR